MCAIPDYTQSLGVIVFMEPIYRSKKFIFVIYFARARAPAPHTLKLASTPGCAAENFGPNGTVPLRKFHGNQGIPGRAPTGCRKEKKPPPFPASKQSSGVLVIVILTIQVPLDADEPLCQALDVVDRRGRQRPLLYACEVSRELTQASLQSLPGVLGPPAKGKGARPCGRMLHTRVTKGAAAHAAHSEEPVLAPLRKESTRRTDTTSAPETPEATHKKGY